MANKRLANANKYDKNEFYTRLADISSEISNYKKHFKNKVVFCNCDDPTWSNFWIYFHQNFANFQLKKLISTHFNKDGTPSYVMEYEGGNDYDTETWQQRRLKGNGDFRSDECIELLKESDIVVTNPPFSLFREYVAQLIEYKKKFIIIGNINAVSYKEFFPLIKEGKVWAGYSFNKTFEFIMGDSYKIKGKGFTDSDGKKHGYVPGVCWYTNIEIPKRNFKLIPELKYEYANHPDWYPKYDNYDAINVGYVGNDAALQKKTNKVEYIPYDYDGIMGVPITFLDKFNPQEFEILGLAPERNDEDNSKFQIKRYRDAIQHNDPNDEKVLNGEKPLTEKGSKVNDGPAVRFAERPTTYPYYTVPSEENDYFKVLYARLLIRRKKSEDNKDRD